MNYYNASIVAVIIGLFMLWLQFVQNGYEFLDVISYVLLVIISTLLLIIIGIIGFFKVTQD